LETTDEKVALLNVLPATLDRRTYPQQVYEATKPVCRSRTTHESTRACSEKYDGRCVGQHLMRSDKMCEALNEWFGLEVGLHNDDPNLISAVSTGLKALGPHIMVFGPTSRLHTFATKHVFTLSIYAIPVYTLYDEEDD